jgi:HEAT repeat protein
MDTIEKMEDCFRAPHRLAEYARDADWRVRYAAAVALGETHDPARLPLLKEMLRREEGRDLYSQPPAVFTNTSDDTRMAEQIGPIAVHFAADYPAETLEGWRCRGRVKQAILFALYEIGAADAEMLEMVQDCILRQGEDYPVKAAAARALGAVGSRDSLAALEAAERIDEWCTQHEARKAMGRINYAARA